MEAAARSRSRRPVPARTPAADLRLTRSLLGRVAQSGAQTPVETVPPVAG